ncbi:MAG: hypothetical protein HY525_03280 [Betaproteobacteria bacterium]|nr:hypothetical protein [Betaproteobacteria bacterium]
MAHFVASPAAHAGEEESEGGKLTAAMPGKVNAVLAKAGETVSKDAPLMVMEAMKMKHAINAPGDGTSSEIFYGVGDQVQEGAPLLTFEAAAV